jgi:hypothetical protein
MSPSINDPYAPPKASMETSGRTDCWRDDKILVVPAGGVLPPRCVKCNEPATMNKRTTFSWHHPGWYVFILVYLFAYVLIALFVYKRAKISIGMCELHRRKRRNTGWAAVGSLILAIASFWLMTTVDYGFMGIVGVAAFIGAMVLAVMASRTLYPVGITREEARLKGCGPQFLDSLASR